MLLVNGPVVVPQKLSRGLRLAPVFEAIRPRHDCHSTIQEKGSLKNYRDFALWMMLALPTAPQSPWRSASRHGERKANHRNWCSETVTGSKLCRCLFNALSDIGVDSDARPFVGPKLGQVQQVSTPLEEINTPYEGSDSHGVKAALTSS